MRREAATVPTAGKGTGYLFARVSGMLDLSRDEKAKVEQLRPRRRTVDRASVRPDGYDVGELALRRKVAGDVRVIGSVIADIRKAFVRVKHKYLLAKLSPNQFEGSDEIRIAADERNSINVIRECVVKHVRRDVYVRPLLFKLDDAHFAVGGLLAITACVVDRWHPNLVPIVIPLDDFKTLDFGECAQVDSLAFNGLGVVRISADSGGVELDRSKRMVASYQCPRERQRIKPFRGRVAAKKPIVQISRIDIDVRFHFCKMLRPRPFRIGASPRIGRASRSDMNLLRGSVRIVPNRADIDKGVKIRRLRFVVCRLAPCRQVATFRHAAQVGGGQSKKPVGPGPSKAL